MTFNTVFSLILALAFAVLIYVQYRLYKATWGDRPQYAVKPEIKNTDGEDDDDDDEDDDDEEDEDEDEDDGKGTLCIDIGNASHEDRMVEMGINDRLTEAEIEAIWKIARRDPDLNLWDYLVVILKHNGAKESEFVKAEVRMRPYYSYEFRELAKKTRPKHVTRYGIVWDIDRSLRAIGMGWWVEWYRFGLMEGWNFRRDLPKWPLGGPPPPLEVAIRADEDD